MTEPQDHVLRVASYRIASDNRPPWCVGVGGHVSYAQAGDVVCTPAGSVHDILELYEEIEGFYLEEPRGHLRSLSDDVELPPGWVYGGVLRLVPSEGGAMANKDKGGSKSSKTAATKSLKEKRQAKKEKAARATSSRISDSR